MPASSSEEAVFYGRTLDKKAKGLLCAARPYGKALLAEMLEAVLTQDDGGELTVLLCPDGVPLKKRAAEYSAMETAS